ncbi:MAG TPA: aspartyl protease family protein [Pyrinomonadaceae bacterium]|nr:aspartyl protease family protein [Pyrinomonadaceae bacterium]
MTVKPANHSYRRRTTGTSLTGGKGMGYVYADIELTSEDDIALNQRGFLPEDEIRRVTCRALVDSGAWDLVINKDVQKRLNLRVLGRGTVQMADETWLDVDIVGPVEVRFENRATTVRAVVLPQTSEVLLGAFPLEGLDAFIDPKGERLLVNPDDIRTVKRVA